MKRQLDHQKGPNIQNNTSDSYENYKTKTNKRIHNYSPPSHENQSQRDTIVQNTIKSNKSQGQFFSSNENDQMYYSSKQEADQFSSTLDSKLLQKELSMYKQIYYFYSSTQQILNNRTKKNLKEALARSNILTHNNSKLQHQNDILEQQTQKADKRCKELIEKLSMEQLKINELNFLNKQLQKELDNFRNDNSDTADRMKNNFETLKKKYDDYVKISEQKSAKVISAIKKCCAVVGQNDRLHTNKRSDFNSEIYQQLIHVQHNSSLTPQQYKMFKFQFHNIDN